MLGLFTTQVLNFLRSKQKLLKYTIKAGGIILIIMGLMIYTGWMNGVSGYLNSFSNNPKNSSQQAEDETTQNKNVGTDESNVITAFDFTLTDQYGNEHTLSDYKGKVVFINFWASWCSPCKKELPDIEELYTEYNFNQDEVVFLGIVNPSSAEYPKNQDKGAGEIKSFIEETRYTFPTLFDETGEVFQNYNISSFPTTFMIDKEGNIVGYVPGMMTKNIMVSVINQTLQVTE